MTLDAAFLAALILLVAYLRDRRLTKRLEAIRQNAVKSFRVLRVHDTRDTVIVEFICPFCFSEDEAEWPSNSERSLEVCRFCLKESLLDIYGARNL